MVVDVHVVALDDPDAKMLIAELDADLRVRYPHQQDEFDKANKLPEGTTLVVAYLDGQPVGCGAFRLFKGDGCGGGAAEIKRMYTRSSARGNGIATRILQTLESLAKDAGYGTAVLETGTNQPEAMRFYAKMGYQPRECYGIYLNEPTSRCFEKALV